MSPDRETTNRLTCLRVFSRMTRLNRPAPPDEGLLNERDSDMRDREPDSPLQERRFRAQFRLASLFWLTLVVAAFFLGRSSDELWERLAETGQPGTTINVGQGACPMATRKMSQKQCLQCHTSVAQASALPSLPHPGLTPPMHR